MKNVKLKVESDEQNLKVQEKVKELNDKENRFAWRVYLDTGIDNYNYQDGDDNRADSSVWKGFRYLVIDGDLDLILCVNEEIWKERPEKEVSFEEFVEEIKEVTT